MARLSNIYSLKYHLFTERFTIYEYGSFKNRRGCSNVATFRPLRGDYDRHNRPTVQGIGKIKKKFIETGNVTDVVRPASNYNVCTAENIGSVSESVVDSPNLAISSCSYQYGLSYDSLLRILHFDLHIHLYKVQLKQQLKPADHSQRCRYDDWALDTHTFNADF